MNPSPLVCLLSVIITGIFKYVVLGGKIVKIMKLYSFALFIQRQNNLSTFLYCCVGFRLLIS